MSAELPPWPDKCGFFGMPDGREDYETARSEAAIARLKVAKWWLDNHAQHDESRGQCYGLVRPRCVGDPPDMVYEEHRCRCGLDDLLAVIGEIP